MRGNVSSKILGVKTFLAGRQQEGGVKTVKKALL